jgi:hypothetical protein
MWDKWIARTLVKWFQNPSVLADVDITPPSREVIIRATACAIGMVQLGFPSPDRVVPNGDGGIVFERRRGGRSESIEIESDGCIYYSAFDGSTLIKRQLLMRAEEGIEQ